MFDPVTLGLTALSMGGSLLSGIGQKQASAKQARLQMIADAQAREANERTLAEVNRKREELGREMLTVPEERYEKQDLYDRTTTTVRDTDDGWIDVDGMMAAAEASGLNPYTFMQLGGLSAYSNRVRNSFTDSLREYGGEVYSRVTGANAAEAYKLMAPEFQLASASQVPQQHSALSAFGGALTAGANTFGTQYRANQSYDLNQQKLDLAGQQLALGLTGQNGLATVLGSQSGGGGGVTSNARSGATKAAGLSDLPYPDKWEADPPKVTNPLYRGFIDSKSPNAEAGEDRYGEVGEFLFGMRNLVSDGVRNVTGRGLEDWGTAAGMNIGSYKKPEDTSWGPAFSRWWNSPTALPTRLMTPSEKSMGKVTPYAPFAGAYPSWATP